MTVYFQAVNEFLAPRAAELTQKTNQFNVTTRRYTLADIQSLMDRNDYLLYTVKVTDKFGDNGTVGLCIIKVVNPTEWLIDTFLLSCRIMNRTIENALMAYIYEKAKTKGIERLIGEYLSTPKNGPAAHFYEQLGFEKVAGKYVFELAGAKIMYPKYIQYREG
jgi:FkbH-like protein